MRTEYFAAIAITAFAAGAGLAAHSVRGQADFPQPSVASVTAFFAPCQTFDTAMGHAVLKAVRIGLPTPDEQLAYDWPPNLPPTRLAARLADSVDPFLHRSGG